MVNYRSLTGRQWHYGQNDCFSLLRDYYKLLGIELPNFSRPASLECSDSLFLKHAKAAGFKEVPFDERIPHDVIIMRLGTKSPMHAAIYVGGDKILHQRINSVSALEPLGRYYRQSVAAVFRHAVGSVGG